MTQICEFRECFYDSWKNILVIKYYKFPNRFSIRAFCKWILGGSLRFLSLASWDVANAYTGTIVTRNLFMVFGNLDLKIFNYWSYYENLVIRQGYFSIARQP